LAIRLFDILFSVILIVLFLPIMLNIMILILVIIEFRPFYSAERVGKDHAVFRHFKFKSMRSGMEHGRVFFEQDRINWFGRFLRKFHLDELPELFLVFIGKMSFVGPRALPQKLLDGLEYHKRLKVKPGLTCLAQIYLMKYGHLDKKLQIRLDNYYVKNQSFKYNLKLILATVVAIFKGKSINTNENLNEDRKRFLI